jgi:hypothetical protein
MNGLEELRDGCREYTVCVSDEGVRQSYFLIP